MQTINLFSSNKNIGLLITIILLLFFFFTLVVPLIFVYYLPQSIIGGLFILYSKYSVFSLLLLVYFLYTGIFIYRIKIDPYVINITSYRSIFSLFYKKDYVDVSHLMLKHYSFFNRPFTFNRTLMLKIKTDNNRLISKRFRISLLTHKEEKRISETLDKIISNNK